MKVQRLRRTNGQKKAANGLAEVALASSPAL